MGHRGGVRGVRWWVLSICVLAALVALTAPRPVGAQDAADDCMDDPLGSAQQFSITAFGDLHLENTDSEGRIAVGGDATLTNFTVNSSRANQPPEGLALSVGGNLVFTNGSIWGHADVGGTATLAGVNAAGGVTQGTPPAVPDFLALRLALAARSDQWADLTANGTVTAVAGGVLLEGDDPARNVFGVAASTLSAAGEINIRVPVGSTTLINVAGTSYSLGNTTTIRYWNGSAFVDWGRDAPAPDLAKLRDGTLWNFPDETELHSQKGIAWQGSILAPKAVMDLTYLQINGNVVVGALYGTGETHLFPPDLCLPDPTPCPPQPPIPTPTPTVTPEPSPTVTPQPTVSPTPTATPQPTISPRPTPTRTPAPIMEPTPTPTAEGGVAGETTDVQICKKVMTPGGRALESVRVHAGETVRFRIRVTNLGTTSARDVLVCDLLPPEMTLVRSPAKPIYRNGRPCLRLPRLRGQRQGYFTVRIARTARGTITNVAAVTSGNSGRHVNPAGVRILPARGAGGGVTG
jgi:choice-of-anchor A domain-containing protein/uncharacterized repeat protein (TIGR01451 family)